MLEHGIILMNLGSPASTKVGDVRRYLNEFLMDERVIDLPYLRRLLLVRGIIAPFRAPKSAEAYREVWTPEGSPLIVHTRLLRDAVQELVDDPVAIAMRYGKPTVDDAFRELLERRPGLEEVTLAPLYPHYARSSYGTAAEHAMARHRAGKYPFRLRLVEPFYKEPGYIAALAAHIKPYLTDGFDQLLFSYHGVPERHVRKDDVTGSHCLATPDCCLTPSPAHGRCYRHHCLMTTARVVEALGLPEGKYGVSFQSRLGRDPWLRPFTDQRLAELPKEGVKRLLVISPAFVSDCLETLEELGMRGKEDFLAAGGESYTLIPCLNERPEWVRVLAGYVRAPAHAGVE